MKKSFVIPAVAALATALGLAGCQTVRPDIPPAARSDIRVEEPGFAPKGPAQHATLVMDLRFGNGEAVTSWTASVVSSGSAVRTWTGTSGVLPGSLVWNGTNDGGADLPEGTYTARLSIKYGKKYESVTVESRPFVLDRTAPTGSVALDPAQFVPSDQGVREPVTIVISAASRVAQLADWTIDVYDTDGSFVQRLYGDWPEGTVAWDGSSLNGGFVAPGATYGAVATVTDVYGLSSSLLFSIPVADLPEATGQARIQARSAGFSPVNSTQPRTIDLVPISGNDEAVKAWKVSIVGANSVVQRSWSGSAESFPKSISWDGRTGAGGLAPEGSYTATLSVDFGKTFQPALVRSPPFRLAISAPSANVVVSPARLAADGKGGIQPVTFTLYGYSTTAALKGWTLGVIDAGGKTAASFEGDWPPTAPSWDGSLAGGGKADPTKAYSYVLRLQDIYGNIGEAYGSLVTGDLPVVTGALSVRPNSSGFSPNGDKVADIMSLSLSYGQPSAAKAWKVAVGSPAAGVVKTYSGTGASLPGTLSWDGKSDTGSRAPEGSYAATLSVDYGTVFAPAQVASDSFLLTTAAPTGKIRLSDPLYSPMEGSSTITMTIDASAGDVPMDSWSMEIFDPAGNLFRSFWGRWPFNSVTWDGKGMKGDLVQSAEDYQVVVKARDRYGNTGILETVVPVDILVEKTPTGYRILASRVFFKAFTADYQDVEPALAAQNMTRLDALARKLVKFPDYRIRIVGHAVSIYWDNPALGRTEQEDVLLPLSKERADAVMKALVDRGLDAGRFATDGVGAADQIVPDSNLKDRWQNRRVAFFLDKQ